MSHSPIVTFFRLYARLALQYGELGLIEKHNIQAIGYFEDFIPCKQAISTIAATPMLTPPFRVLYGEA